MGALFIIIVFAIYGLIIWGSSEIPLIFREIAHNTRKDGQTGPDYKAVELLGILFKVFAVLIWLAGLGAAFTGSLLESFF